MKKIIAIITIILVIAAAAGYFYHRQRDAANRPVEYEFAAVTRGDIERIIVSAGTLSPVGSVEVSTQVSGTIEKVLADFNDTVTAGQIIAEIDRSVLLSRLSEVQASHARAGALFAQSEQELKRGESLFQKGLISEQELLRLRTDFQTQRASLQVARAAVTTAQENLRYATIRSPVRGTVISRSVDVGQTVAASLSAPTLFIIAEDLRRMQIMAQVDETDIGRIRDGIDVRFSVQAYPNKTYAGKVSQVRLQPEVVQNVVTYTVVILADNHDGTLLPGMTANVEFIEAREENALTVPMAALRFRPPQEIREQFAKTGGDDGDDRKNSRGVNDTNPDNNGKNTGDINKNSRSVNNDIAINKNSRGVNSDIAIDKKRGEGKSRDRDGGKGRDRVIEPGRRATLWTADDAGNLSPLHVRLGLNDGVRSAVTGDDALVEGTRVISGEAKNEKSKKKKDADRKQRSILPQGGGQGGPRRI